MYVCMYKYMRVRWLLLGELEARQTPKKKKSPFFFAEILPMVDDTPLIDFDYTI